MYFALLVLLFGATTVPDRDHFTSCTVINYFLCKLYRISEKCVN